MEICNPECESGHEKKSILIVNQHFYPGYKAGGPIQALYNLCQQLGSEYKLYVYTTSQDTLDTPPYAGVREDDWNPVGETQVFYASKVTFSSLVKVIKEVSPKAIYLNSFFDPLSLRSLLLCRLFFRRAKVILAPRGELLPAALAIKSFKKKIVLNFFKWFRVQNEIMFHVTAEHDLLYLKHLFGNKISVSAVPDLVSQPRAESIQSSKASNKIRVVSVCRFNRIKNIDFWLEVLNKVGSQAEITYHIYGPIDDKPYYQKCCDLIETINHKPNMHCSYLGVLSPCEILDRLPEYDLFVLPSKSENFGYALYEALASGVPIMTSNTTPWSEITKYGAGYFLPLDQDIFIKSWKEFLALSVQCRMQMKYNALVYSRMYYEQSECANKMRNLFDLLLA